MTREHTPAWRWSVCVLLLLATMLNYMDRQTLSQSATDIGIELGLRNEDYGKLEQAFGLAFAAGGLTLGFVADRVSLRWLYPAVVLAWSAAGFATGWAKGFRRVDDLPCAARILRSGTVAVRACGFTASARAIRTSPGNSLIQSGAFDRGGDHAARGPVHGVGRAGKLRGPFQVIGVLGGVWILGWLTMIRGGDLDRIEANAPNVPEVTTTSRAMFVPPVPGARRCGRRDQPLLAFLSRLAPQAAARTVRLFGFRELFHIPVLHRHRCRLSDAGLAVRCLSARGRSVHYARVVTFLGCAALTALGSVISIVPAGPLMLGLLLLIAAGALGLFPIYYSLTQELSAGTRVRSPERPVASPGSQGLHALADRPLGRSHGIVLYGPRDHGTASAGCAPVLAIFWDRREVVPRHGMSLKTRFDQVAAFAKYKVMIP